MWMAGADVMKPTPDMMKDVMGNGTLMDVSSPSPSPHPSRCPQVLLAHLLCPADTR